MKFLFKFGKELFWTIFWVFIALIVGYFVLTFLSNRNIPIISSVSNWVESHSTAQ